MVNGELNFEAPWQGRVFAMANALCDQGLYEWSEFQDSLIAAIACEPDTSTTEAYYLRFQTALETLLARKQVVAPEALEDRVGALAARPHDHDH